MGDKGLCESGITEKKLIAVNGNWYDITNFIDYHPGGTIINRFVGKDASSVFQAFHKPTTLKHWKPVAKVQVNHELDAINEAFVNLGDWFERQGYFKTDYYWYCRKLIVTFCMLGTCIGFVCWVESPYRIFGAIALAAFWQQCGFFMHDAEHNQLTRDRNLDSWIGVFFATMCFGVSSSWWRHNHFIHHALTACVHYETNFFDPQMREPVWVQNWKLYPFYQSKIKCWCIKVQHITFLPICIILGRIGIMIDSMKSERDPKQLVAFSLHLIWTASLLFQLSNWKERLLFYLIAAFLQGILHIQLLISHYSKQFHFVEDIETTKGWFQMQVESNIDILTPWWMDWFHGGLNFHLVHHLYPRMPRHNFRQATAFVRKLCEAHNLHYDSCEWSAAVKRTLLHLQKTSEHFSLDPR